MFPDVSRELVLKRKTFTAARKALQCHNIRCKLAYPATLRFTWKGRSCSFTSAKEAEQFIEENSGPGVTQSEGWGRGTECKPDSGIEKTGRMDQMGRSH